MKWYDHIKYISLTMYHIQSAITLICQHMYAWWPRVIICKIYFKYEMRKRNEILMMKVI